MAVVKAFNLVVRFVVELCLLAAVSYGGFQLDGGWPVRMAAGIGAPLLVAGVWGLFVAPKAWRRLPEPWRLGLEIILFGWGVAALAAAERPLLAAALGITFFFNRVLVMVWKQQ